MEAISILEVGVAAKVGCATDAEDIEVGASTLSVATDATLGVVDDGKEMDAEFGATTTGVVDRDGTVMVETTDDTLRVTGVGADVVEAATPGTIDADTAVGGVDDVVTIVPGVVACVSEGRETVDEAG